MQHNEWIGWLSNGVIFLLFAFAVGYLILLRIEKSKQKHLLQLHKKKPWFAQIKGQTRFIQSLYRDIETWLNKKNKGYLVRYYFYGILFITFLIFIMMLFTGQIVFAILYPLIVLWFIRCIIRTAISAPIVEMQEALPSAIDNLIRVLSKYADIKSVIYETSQMTTGPLKEELYLLSRQMNTRNPMLVLEEFSEKHDSIWLNNFAFVLMAYLREASKEETIENLRHLRNLLEEENKTKKRVISERKPSLALNYSLAVIATVTGVLSILFNPIAFDFFFHSYLGLFCFSAGYASVLVTIYMNVKLMKIEK